LPFAAFLSLSVSLILPIIRCSYFRPFIFFFSSLPSLISFFFIHFLLTSFLFLPFLAFLVPFLLSLFCYFPLSLCLSNTKSCSIVTS
jgi:hypothetical protein